MSDKTNNSVINMNQKSELVKQFWNLLFSTWVHVIKVFWNFILNCVHMSNEQVIKNDFVNLKVTL